MSAAARITCSGGRYMVTAPDGRTLTFRNHGQALDYAELVLRDEKLRSPRRKARNPTWTIRLQPTGSHTASYQVIDQDGRVVASLSTKYLAENKVEDLARQARMRVRKCLCCAAPFASEGAHNRMCPSCRHRSLNEGWA